MKIFILIISWINRIIMLPFILSLLLAIIYNDFFMYSLYIAFVVGIYQIFSFLMSLITWRRMRKENRKKVVLYFCFVIVYFLSEFLIYKIYKSNSQSALLIIFTVGVPIILSLFWTYVLESLKITNHENRHQ